MDNIAHMNNTDVLIDKYYYTSPQQIKDNIIKWTINSCEKALRSYFNFDMRKTKIV